jgi:hypothetical protein
MQLKQPARQRGLSEAEWGRGLGMMIRLLSAAVACLATLFIANVAGAATYTVNVQYDILNGTITPPAVGSGNIEFESQNIAVALPTLHIGDVINTTITFSSHGLRLALTISDPDANATQLFQILYRPSDGTGGIVSTISQLSFIQPHGDVLTPVVLTGSSGCNTCVAASVHANVTDTSFSFRGLSALTTITSIPEPFPVGDMHFQVWTLGGGSIEITHGASHVSAVPEPSTWAMMILGFAGIGFMAYRRPIRSPAHQDLRRRLPLGRFFVVLLKGKCLPPEPKEPELDIRQPTQLS